jgi:hypothetical protein
MVAWLRILGARPYCAWNMAESFPRATDASPGSGTSQALAPGWKSSRGGFVEIRLPTWARCAILI